MSDPHPKSLNSRLCSKRTGWGLEPRHQSIYCALQYVAGRQLVHQFAPSRAAGVGFQQGARHRLGRPAFVPEQDRQAQVRDVPSEGEARLAAGAFPSLPGLAPAESPRLSHIGHATVSTPFLKSTLLCLLRLTKNIIRLL